MDMRDLNLLQQAARLMESLENAENWYGETPKHGGPEVVAWRGKGDPEEMARIALRNLEGVISRYIGRKA